MLFQPSNIYPSTFSGIGAGTVDVTQDLNVSWQVNGDTPMTAYQIKIYQNDSGSTLMYDSGSVSVSPVFEPHDKYGNATYFTAIISAAALSTAGIVNGYQYGYKMLITQWWGVSDYVEQTSASVFITRSTPTLAINTITTPVASNSLTITANYSQAQGDPISTVEWVFALAGSESTPIRKTGAISTQVLSFDADGLITGNTYSIMCKVVTSTGMEASTGFVQFPVSYSSSSLGINYQLAQLKNSSAVYLSWDDLGSNILSYPYTDTTKTTNGITFTVNGEGDVVVTGTATADAYFTIAQGTLSQLGITAGQKFIVTSGYSSAKIVVTETNSSNVVVSTITGNDPLQYIATSTTNTLKFSIVIPSGASFGTSQQLQPMIAIEDKIVALNDLSVTMQPIQDLHGYDHPWPAGGGKNKFYYPTNFNTTGSYGLVYKYDKDTETFSITGTNTNTSAYIALFLRTSDGTATPSLTVGQTCYVYHNLPTGTYLNLTYFNGNGVTGGFSIIGGAAGTGDYVQRSFIVPNDYASFNQVQIGVYGSATQINKTDIHIALGTDSAFTEWTPYSNICPISGLTGLSVYRTGVNVWDEEWENGTFNTTTGVPINTTSTNKQIRSKNTRIPVRGGESYYFKWVNNSASSGLWTMFFDADENIITGFVPSGGYVDKSGNCCLFRNRVVEVPENAAFCKFYCTVDYGDTYNHDIAINYPATVTTYEQYNGNTYSVDWTTQAGTVYGCTVDVVTGVLTVTHGVKVLDGSENWSWSPNNNLASTAVSNGVITNGTTQYNIYTQNSTFKDASWAGRSSVNGSIGMFYGASAIYAKYSGFTTAAEAKSFFTDNPTTVVYELATPLTYQLTPQEIAAFVGTNNVWSTGDSVSVTYTKDTGSQATLSGAIVTFSDSNAVLIPTPQYIPGITGISIYRYLQGESALQHVYDLATGATTILDYYAPSQMQVSYLIVAHSGIGDLFLQTAQFTPTFWFFSILLCDKDSNGDYHVSKEYIFKYGVETGAVSNNNDPTIQKNFTPYPNRQPISTLYKTGKISGYIGKTNNLNRYSDSISLQNAIYDISVSSLDKFLKSRKGDVIKVDTASSIQMKTEDNTVQQALKATVDWVEVGEASQVSIVSVPSDSFWPIS